MYLRNLTDRELARVAESCLDPIFSTDLERELTRRFVRSIMPQNESGAVQAIVRQIDVQLQAIHAAAPRGLSDPTTTDAVTNIERLVRDLAQIAQGDDE